MADARDACPLLVFADDWGRHPSSCQHLIRRLLPQHPVWWVNTIGMRPPRLDRATFRRAWEKLRQWSPGHPALPTDAPAPIVLNPRMWPYMRNGLDRWLNRSLLAATLNKALGDAPEPPIAITTLPITADLLDQVPARRWVYYCVDDFSEWPGLDGDAIRVMERKLIERADVLIAVSQTLQTKLAAHGRSAHLLSHGVDLDMWRQPATAPLPAAYSHFESPLVVFWGLVDRRMDIDLVRQLANDLERGTILLVGPRADPDPALLTLPRVKYLPSLPYDALPALAGQADVLVMPYADLPVTRAMQPLKLKEYLATGKPVVARNLPANQEWSDCLDLVTSPLEFSASVRKRLQTGLPTSQGDARTRLELEGWDAKADEFKRLILGESVFPQTSESKRVLEMVV